MKPYPPIKIVEDNFNYFELIVDEELIEVYTDSNELNKEEHYMDMSNNKVYRIVNKLAQQHFEEYVQEEDMIKRNYHLSVYESLEECLTALSKYYESENEYYEME